MRIGLTSLSVRLNVRPVNPLNVFLYSKKQLGLKLLYSLLLRVMFLSRYRMLLSVFYWTTTVLLNFKLRVNIFYFVYYIDLLAMFFFEYISIFTLILYFCSCDRIITLDLSFLPFFKLYFLQVKSSVKNITKVLTKYILNRKR